MKSVQVALWDRNRIDETISHYLIFDKPGKGGLGVVFKAEGQNVSHASEPFNFLSRML